MSITIPKRNRKNAEFQEKVIKEKVVLNAPATINNIPIITAIAAPVKAGESIDNIPSPIRIIEKTIILLLAFCKLV
jgi:hypothetical protein